VMRCWSIPVCMLVLWLVAGCSRAPGRPAQDSEVLAPDKVLNFTGLYQPNCAGCHGVDGKGGAAIGLNNKNLLAIVDDATLRRVIAEGVQGTAMSAFARSSGGLLTDAQVNAIVRGIRSNWGNSDFGDSAPPSHVPRSAGSPARGRDVYSVYCSSCHGSVGRGGSRASSIVDTAYLALVSDQYLRTIVIAGRPEIGQPDWRDDVPGRPMSEQDVSDVIAWLSSQRPNTVGQSYAASSIAIGTRP
jgi:cytochrome c oxidase cbb3-type subunit 3